ncbi:MAG: hypothetical protein ACETWG_11235 [Candidatus Neomarinimicrobiota bacterium]
MSTRHNRFLIWIPLFLLGCSPWLSTPFGVMSEYNRMAQLDLWPGFKPAQISVAIYDGKDTYLFRHPHPPEEFSPVKGHYGTWLYRGQHEAVNSNTNVQLADWPTATIIISPEVKVSMPQLAAVAIHEAFHVFQSQRYPAWTANEMDLLIYPDDDADLLALRRLETAALRSAIRAQKEEDAARWALSALTHRQDRFSRMTPNAAAYERGTELKEGLAQYVQSRAQAGRLKPDLPDEGFPLSKIRQRCYQTGHAWALLLDRFLPRWHTYLDSVKSTSLDQLLSQSIILQAYEPHRFPAPVKSHIQKRAKQDVRNLQAQIQRKRKRYFSRSGWLVTLSLPDRPLNVMGFDPMNIEKLGSGELLHTRWLKLGSQNGSLEVLDNTVLTKTGCDHPLLPGIQELIMAGLPTPPQVEIRADTVRIQGHGLTLHFHGLHVSRSDQTKTIRLE